MTVAELFRLGCPQGEPGTPLGDLQLSPSGQRGKLQSGPDHRRRRNDYLMMLLCAVLGTGHRVALENPTYRQAYRLFANLSFDTRTVDMDARGDAGG